METLESNKFVDEDLNKYFDVLFDEKVKKPKIKRNKKSMIKTWTPEDPLAKIFGHLNHVKNYNSVFEYAKDKAHLKDCGIEFDLSLGEMEMIAKDFSVYYRDNGKGPKSPRASLRNFCKNHAQRKKDRASKNKSSDSDYLRGGKTREQYVGELQAIIDGAKRD